MKKFELYQGFEEIDIGGEIYTIDLSDEKRKQYMLEGKRLQEKSKKFQDIPDEMSEEDVDKLLVELKETVEEISNKILGDGAYEKLYVKTNGSLFSIFDVIFDVIEYISQLENDKLDKKKEKYTKHKKKKK